MGKIIEGRWDCSYCDVKGIKGSVRICPNCGKTRGEDVKFYIGNPKDYTTEKIEDAPDWLCSYCDTYNKASETKCHNCGHLRNNEDTNYFEVQKKKDANYNPVTKKYVGVKETFNSKWTCNSCQTINDESNITCKSCGAPKSERQEFGNNRSAKKIEYPIRDTNSYSNSRPII